MMENTNQVQQGTSEANPPANVILHVYTTKNIVQTIIFLRVITWRA